MGCSTTYKVTNYHSKEAFYKDFNKSAADTKVKVTLTDDSILDVSAGAEIDGDSLHLNYYPGYYPAKLRTKQETFLLSEVMQASCTDHWKGVAPGIGIGLGSGMFLGSMTSAFILNLKSGGNHPERDWFSGFIVGSFSGLILGVVIGYIIGGNNIYQFNP